MAHAGSVSAADDVTSAAALRNQYKSLSAKLAHNQFNRPLYLSSTESNDRLKGDIYALMVYPFSSVNAALNESSGAADHWCDVLMLHLNTKYCRAITSPSGTLLEMRVGKKYDQPLEDAYQLVFNYRIKTATPDYFTVELTDDSGPLGTSDYRIMLEAVSVEGNQTFMHLTYAYAYGFAGRVALKSYLATAGIRKVGFTVTGQQEGQPEYINGMRGLVERNTMRYYLAIEAYLNALTAAPNARLEQRLLTWFNAAEQYPRQLHEVERSEYIDMKHSEYRRLQTP